MSKVLMNWTQNPILICPKIAQAKLTDNIEIDDIVTEICQKPEPTTSHHDKQMNQTALDITDLDLVDSVLQDQQNQSKVLKSPRLYN